MRASEKGIELIKFFEDCRLKSYQDTAGVWTIGYGHTRGVKPNQSCTQQQADKWLVEDLKDSELRVDKNLDIIKVEVTQNEYDTLVSLAYNLRSFEILVMYLPNRIKFKQKMLLYCKDITGNFLKGLKIRRISERLLFEGRKWKSIAKEMQRMTMLEINITEDNLFRSVIDEQDIPPPRGID